MKNYYEILGIDRHANTDEVKRAFRKLALEFHPDKNKSLDAKDKFIEIYEAYEILVDETKRARFDTMYFETSGENSSDKQEFDNETKTARQNGEKYSKFGFVDFSLEFIGNISLEIGANVVVEGVGKIFEVTGHAIGEILSGAR